MKIADGEDGKRGPGFTAFGSDALRELTKRNRALEQENENLPRPLRASPASCSQ
ncbi:hypothetical protein [Oerskovia sp. Root22]|uniref:hypothetical protein n=1 Tax=Oerskovia sp. Root22 TaxID=1736494 RepID=UPI0012F83257|nr:hypothetical protein [Oerskovia sp. Root22]